MELVAGLETERRGLYAGAVGYWGYGGAMDTAIAIRTIVVRDGVAYLQAGGGIVHDSNPADEYVETVNKLGATAKALKLASDLFSASAAGDAPEKPTPSKRTKA